MVKNKWYAAIVLIAMFSLWSQRTALQQTMEVAQDYVAVNLGVDDESSSDDPHDESGSIKKFFEVVDPKRNRLIETVILPTVTKLRRTLVANHVPCKQKAIGVISGAVPKGYFRRTSLKPAFTCGPVPSWSNPYAWEDRIKGRLFERMKAHGVTNCPFAGLDVGGARGDWVIAAGVEAPRSRYAVVEANPKLFAQMTQDFDTNPGLPERVFAHHAAVMSDDAFFGHFEKVENGTKASRPLSNGWDGPTLCVDGGKADGVMKTRGNRQDDECSRAQVAVPVLTVDIVMSDFWASTSPSPSTAKSGGDLFFAKLDIEGSEYGALLGAESVFSNKETRPCYVYIEIKTIEAVYEKAFNLLRHAYGYTEYTDIDSGLWGSIGYPPTGAAYRNEGNYEFRLPATEMEECTERVRRHTSCRGRP